MAQLTVLMKLMRSCAKTLTTAMRRMRSNVSLESALITLCDVPVMRTVRTGLMKLTAVICQQHETKSHCLLLLVEMLKCDLQEEFDCGQGKECIPVDRVCDHNNDCGNWEDEPKDSCGKNECQSENGGCEQICFDTPAGFFCGCKQGYQLSDNTSCVGKYVNGYN